MADVKTIEQVRAERVEKLRKEAESDAIDDWHSGRFAGLQTGTGTKAVSLRPILENPDGELLLEVARRGDTPAARDGARRELTARKISEICDAFEKAESEFHAVPANFQLLFNHAAHHRLGGQKVEGDPEWALIDANQLTVPVLQESYRALRDAGRLIVPRGTARPLSAEQLDHVAATAEIEGPNRAIEQYFRESFGGACPHFAGGARELLGNYPELATKAAKFVFPHIVPDFQPSEEWERFVAERTAHRRIVTIPVLSTVWAEFKGVGRTTAAQETGPTNPPRVEDLSDAEIDSLMLEARRERRFFNNPLASARPIASIFRTKELH